MNYGILIPDSRLLPLQKTRHPNYVGLTVKNNNVTSENNDGRDNGVLTKYTVQYNRDILGIANILDQKQQSSSSVIAFGLSVGHWLLWLWFAFRLHTVDSIAGLARVECQLALDDDYSRELQDFQRQAEFYLGRNRHAPLITLSSLSSSHLDGKWRSSSSRTIVAAYLCYAFWQTHYCSLIFYVLRELPMLASSS